MGDCIPIIQSYIWQWKVSQIFNFAAHRNSTTRHLCPLLFISHIYTTQKSFHCFLIFHSYQGYCVPHQNKLRLHLYPLIHTETLLRGRLHVSDMKFMPAWKKFMLHAFHFGVKLMPAWYTICSQFYCVWFCKKELWIMLLSLLTKNGWE